MPKEYEAALRRPDGTAKRMFAGRTEDDALDWFHASYRDETGREPSADEVKYFFDGHDVIAGELTWRLDAFPAKPGPGAEAE